MMPTPAVTFHMPTRRGKGVCRFGRSSNFQICELDVEKIIAVSLDISSNGKLFRIAKSFI